MYRTKPLRHALALACLAAVQPALATDDLEALRQQLEHLQQDYQTRLNQLEQRLRAAAQTPPPAATPAGNRAGGGFNPAISVILDGRYTAFKRDPEAYHLPGFQLGGEAGLGEEGFAVGHSEIIMSANVDDKFYAQITAALASHDGATEVELEEAFIQTIGLGHGLTAKAGRFFSALGYLNSQHPHAWDFADAPLIYRGLFGDQLYDDGVQLSWQAPTDTYLLLGGELLRGGGHDGAGGYTAFAKLGGDLGLEHSWQLGLSRYAARPQNRGGLAHNHGAEVTAHDDHDDHDDHDADEHAALAALGFSGDSRVSAIDWVWRWAPGGNPKQRQLKLQGEYFWRDEDGELLAESESGDWLSAYEGRQRGFYLQAVYQFVPQWRVGLRYDRLLSRNWAAEEAVLESFGLHSEGHTPRRYSLMLDWSNSEYSRIRLQYNRDQSNPDADDQVFVQYIHSIGAHGAHSF